MLRVKSISTNSKLYKASDSAAGYDLSCTISTTVEAGGRACLPTGICCEFPSGTYGRIAGRSSLASKFGLIVGGGVIDPDYIGEIKVIVFNLSKIKYDIAIGDRIAQLIIECYSSPPIEYVEDLPITNRFESGFGSTGK